MRVKQIYIIMKTKLEKRSKAKDKKDRLLILRILKGEARTCDHCGSHDLKEIPRGNPMSFEQKDFVLVEINCNECEAQYEVFHEMETQKDFSNSPTKL